MLTAQNNQPDDVGQGQPVAEPTVSQETTAEQDAEAVVQIDPNLQQTIDGLTQDLNVVSSESSDQAPSKTDSQNDQKLEFKEQQLESDAVEVPKLDPVNIASDQLDEKQAEDQTNIGLSENPVESQVPQTDDLNIAEPIFSQTPVAETNTPPVNTTETEQIPVEQDTLINNATSDQSLSETSMAEEVTNEANNNGSQISELTNATTPSTDNTVQVATQASPLDHQTTNTNAGGFSFSVTNSFFDVLVNNGIISPKQAEELRQENLSSGRSYEELVLSKQLATESDVVQAKAEFNNLPYIKLSATGVDPEALTLLDEGIAKRYQALPFGLDKENKSLQVAMVNPLDLATIEFLKQKTGYRIDAHYSESSEISRMIDERYSQSLSSEVTEALKSTHQYKEKGQEDVELDQQAGAILRDAPISRIVENILDFAMKSSASDIHIEPQINRTRVRYRIDGILAEKLILPQNVHDAVVSRIKIMANLKIDEKRLPQDGRFNYKANNAEVDLRTSTLPTVHGEKIVMRLLQKDMAVPSLEDLGMIGLGLQRVKEAIKVSYGIILITGPTGSGKTTTLYSILNIINKVGVNIMTLEDPVEYQIPGVSQVQTNPKAGLTFASGLRSFLRQDPDVIMVGEIRDNETADLALQASLTGHLVFSTLHTNSAAGALPRLLDMEAEPFLLASSITLAMGQRVVRKINPKYKEEYKPEAVVVEDIKKVLGTHFDRWCKDNGKNPNEITLFRPSNKRPGTEPEYKGRIGIFEVMPTSPEIASLILNRKPASEVEKVAIQQGMLLMKQDGYLKVLDGITTIEEVLRVAEVT
jgi:type IV pilus assembly protein PilB